VGAAFAPPMSSRISSSARRMSMDWPARVAAPISIRVPRWATRATIPNQTARPRVNAEYARPFRIDPTPKTFPSSFRKFSTKAAGPYRASGRQAQTIQAHRTTLREDGAELWFVRCACSRLHLDQIRPHGLGCWLLPPSAPAEKTSAPEDHARQSCSDDRSRHGGGIYRGRHDPPARVDRAVAERGIERDGESERIGRARRDRAECWERSAQLGIGKDLPTQWLGVTSS
jgi:hypothetical protein